MTHQNLVVTETLAQQFGSSGSASAVSRRRRRSWERSRGTRSASRCSAPTRSGGSGERPRHERTTTGRPRRRGDRELEELMGPLGDGTDDTGEAFGTDGMRRGRVPQDHRSPRSAPRVACCRRDRSRRRTTGSPTSSRRSSTATPSTGSTRRRPRARGVRAAGRPAAGLYASCTWPAPTARRRRRAWWSGWSASTTCGPAGSPARTSSTSPSASRSTGSHHARWPSCGPGTTSNPS